MAKSTSIAKITRPRVPDVLPRTRLFRLLDQTRRRSPVIWVSGPAGSGKTTLVSSFLDSSKLPSLWYQVDEGDADLATFFYYMSLAAKKAAPRYKQPLPLLTPEYAFGVSTFTRRFFENFCSRLRPPYVLVFDNYQDIPPESAFHEAMRTGLSALPEGMTALIISRFEPPASFSDMHAGNSLHVIGWNDLKLTAQESKGIAKLQDVGRPHSSLFEWLHEKAQGWAAGLVLLTRVLRSEGIHPEALKDLAPENVFDYFANELFDRIDGPMQDFLLRAAIVPKITPGLAEALTGNKAAGRILSNLNRRNFFTEKRSQPELSYQFHSLFRDFLLHRAASFFSVEELSELRLKAANLIGASGGIEDAAELLMQAGAWKELTTLILANARMFVQQGRNKLLEKWIIALPANLLSSDPWLNYWQGACKMSVDLNESRKCFERAYHLFKAGGNAPGLYLSWAGVVDTYVFEWTDFKPLDLWIEEIEWLLESYPSFPSPEIEARATAGIFCALMYRRPDHPDMPLWEERALRLALSANDPYLQLTISSHLILYFSWWNGKQTKAELLVRTLHHTAKSFECSPFTTIVWGSIEGAYLWMACHFDESVKSLEHAITTAEKTGIHLWDAMLFANMVYCNLTQGKFDQAAHYLEKMSFVLKTQRNADISHYHFLRAFESLALGKLQLALQHIHAGMKFSKDAGVPYIYHFYITSLADILVELGEFEKAKPYLTEARRFGRAMKSHCLEYQYCWLSAVIALRSNDRNTGHKNLSCYLRISRECRTVNHAWWRSSAMIPLLAEALEAGIEEAHVQEVIKLHGLVPAESHLYLDTWPWPVKVFTLGQFRIELDGKPVLFGGKTPKKPLELLKAIIALGGREVSEEKVIDELWPEAAGDLASKSFEMALQRLRRLLGNDKAVRRQEGRLTLDARYCWTDLRAFEQFVLEAEQSLRNEERKQKDRSKEAARTEKLEKAFAQYKGHFLPSDTREPWLTSTRERLRSKFLRLVTKAGEEYEQAGEWKQAIDCFELGLERDAACEEFYQHLITCHQKLGHRSEAVKTYQRCRAALRDGLGLEPSAKTEEIYSSIRSSNLSV